MASRLSPRSPACRSPSGMSEVELPEVGSSGAAFGADAFKPDGGALHHLPAVPELAGARSRSRSGSPARKLKPLGLLPLVAMIFYEVSGGPFGIEGAISEGSPLLAILGFMVLPLVWSIPEALVTAELATTFPENSGFVAWVTAAFGPFWGFQEGFWKWVSGVIDNAVYPVMFLTYLQEAAPVLKGSGVARTAVLVALNAGLTYMNYRGLDAVGAAAVKMTVFTLAPFGLMCLIGLPHVKPSNWFKLDVSRVNWVPFLNIMFWNLNYWDSVSTLAGEVSDPSRTFPRALAGAMALVVTSYLAPLLVGLGVMGAAGTWRLGFFVDVAEAVGGRWLGWWMVAAAAVSQLGQFQAEMSADSYMLSGMAERGFLPAALARRSRHGTPTAAILCSSVGIMTMASFNFTQIVELLNLVYCIAELLEFGAFLYLRVKYPALPRPFRVPLSTAGCAAMLAPAVALLALLVALPMAQGDTDVIVFTLAVCAVGAGLYPFWQLVRRRGWLEFEATTPGEFHSTLERAYAGAAAPTGGGGAAAGGGGDTEALLDGGGDASRPGSRSSAPV